MPQSLAQILVHLVFSTKNRNDGYGIFSISPAHRPALEAYIANQEEHHQKVTFQDEYRRLLNKYGVSFDERYLWD